MHGVVMKASVVLPTLLSVIKCVVPQDKLAQAWEMLARIQTTVSVTRAVYIVMVEVRWIVCIGATRLS